MSLRTEKRPIVQSQTLYHYRWLLNVLKLSCHDLFVSVGKVLTCQLFNIPLNNTTFSRVKVFDCLKLFIWMTKVRWRSNKHTPGLLLKYVFYEALLGIVNTNTVTYLEPHSVLGLWKQTKNWKSTLHATKPSPRYFLVGRSAAVDLKQVKWKHILRAFCHVHLHNKSKMGPNINSFQYISTW